MKIKDYKKDHPRIYERILECQKEQHDEVNDTLSLRRGFGWNLTKEGDSFWYVVDRDPNHFYTLYPQFEYGDEVMVSDDGEHWYNYIFIHHQPKEEYPYLCRDINLNYGIGCKHCKPLPKKKELELTLEEIAEKFGVDVNLVKIKKG